MNTEMPEVIDPIDVGKIAGPFTGPEIIAPVLLVRYFVGGEEDQDEWNDFNRQRAEAALENNDFEQLANINELTRLHEESLAATERLEEDRRRFEEEG